MAERIASLARRALEAVVRVPTGVALAVFLSTAGVCLVGGWLGPGWFAEGATGGGFWDRFSRFDALHYQEICRDGYAYWPDSRSNVAFFPAYPLAARAVVAVTGLGTEEGLLLTANLFLAGAAILLVAYLAQRRRESSGAALDSGAPRRLPAADVFAVVAFGVWPTTFFFRMPYSESLFVFLALLAMYAMRRGWPLPVAALIVGAATAARPVGVALVPPLLLYARACSATRTEFWARAALVTPLALWGLGAYVDFQNRQFDDPFAFIKTQDFWRIRGQSVDPVEKAGALASGRAVWAVYDPGDRAYWRRIGSPANPLLSLQFFNPLYFAAAVVLVAVGAWKGWLVTGEWLLSAGLLAIPYFTKGYENGMLSQGRFAAVVFPAYIVLGELLARSPRAFAVTFLLASAAMLGLSTALFAAGEMFF